MDAQDDQEKGLKGTSATSPSSKTSQSQGQSSSSGDRRSRWVESIQRFERVVSGGRAKEATFISLNEVIKKPNPADNSVETTKTTSTSTEEKQWFFSPDSIGNFRPPARVNTLHDGDEELEKGLPQDLNEKSNAPRTENAEGIQKRVKREETLHSTTTVTDSAANGGKSKTISEEYMKTSTAGFGSDLDGANDDAELNTMSPILGAQYLPSLYNNIAVPRLPLSRGPSSSAFGPNAPDNLAEPGDSTEPSRNTRTQIRRPSAASSDNGFNGLEAVIEENTTNPGVGSNIRLQISLYNQSGINLPISTENDHSTLEYIQVIETASFRQYSFNDEIDGEGAGGILHRSRSGLRRMLSARNKFITQRTRSFMRRLQREVDLEMQDPDAAWRPAERDQARINDGQQGAFDGPVELDGFERSPAPYELNVSPTHEGWGQWGARPQLTNFPTFTRSQTLSRMCCALFGRNLPHELQPVCKVYMAQLDKRLTNSMKSFELQTPNTLNWSRPLQYLVGCLKVVASRMDASLSIEQFVESNFAYLTTLMRDGPAAAAATEDASPMAKNNKPDQVAQQQEIKLAHEWMLFCLEAWTMLDMSAVCKNRHDLRLSDNFCKAPLKDTLEALLPRLHARYTQAASASSAAYSKSTQIFPREMTAQMLQDLGGVEFMWTDDITQHLTLDTKHNSVKIYSHVAFAYLHAEAGTESSISKSGLNFYHHTLTEITSSYLLLFGHNERSRRIFANIDLGNRSPGYFDIFSSAHALPSTKPKSLYTTLDDFPIFGDRILELRGLLRPKGLAGLWRDTRDTLQWYTFWAVVVIGGVSLLLGVGQMAVGVLQAWASMKALEAGA